MDVVRFTLEEYVDEEEGFRYPTINIYLNGQNLLEIVHQAEERNRGACKYVGIAPASMNARYVNFFGQGGYLQYGVLLVCTCQIEMCNCIRAWITVEDNIVRWENIKSPWMGGLTPSPWVDWAEAADLGWIPYDYSSIPFYVFDRGQYIEALDQIKYWLK